MRFFEKIGGFLSAKEVGRISEFEIAELSKAADLLRRADAVWLRWSELNDAVGQLSGERVDAPTKAKIEELVLTSHEQLKKLNPDGVEPRALNELRLVQEHNRAVTDEEEDKDRPDYFSAEDLAVTTELGWAKRFIVKTGDKGRQPARIAAARAVEKIITEKKLALVENQLLVIECAVTLGNAKLVGPLQQLAAERCDKVWRNYLSEPTPARLVKLKQVYEKLRQALDVEGLFRHAEERAEEFESSLKEKIARQALVAQDLLLISKKKKDNPGLQLAHNSVEAAAQAVQAAFNETMETLAQKLALLRGVPQPEGDKQQNETAFAAVSAIFDDDNLEQQLWVQPCANAMKELTQAMEALSKLLNVKAPALPAHEASRALPAAEEITDAELVDYDSAIDPEAARELGLAKKELRAFPEAGRLINEIVEKKIDPKTEPGKKRLSEEWPEDCPPPFVPPEKYWNKFYPGIPFPPVSQWVSKENGDFCYVEQIAEGKIIANLTGKKNKAFLPRFNGEMVYASSQPDEDWDAVDKNEKNKLQTESHSDKLLNAILAEAGKPPHVGCVNITRETIDEVLWRDDPGVRVPSYAQIAVLKKLVGADWENWEIRCANQREIEGKHNLWSHLDGYFFDDGMRRGLFGGYRVHGGASSVDHGPRSKSNEHWAVRLVLSRKQG